MSGSQPAGIEPSKTEGGSLRSVMDLAAVVLAALGTFGLAVIFGRYGGPTPLRVPLGLVFVFFLPGYAVSSALFPESGGDTDEGGITQGTFRVDGVERLALSVGLSLFLVPLTGLGLSAIGEPVTLTTVLGTLTALVVVAATAAGVRRLRCPPDRRWHPSVLARTQAGVDYATASGLNGVIAALVVTATVGAGAAVAVSDNGERYTEFAVLVPSDDGTPSATGYPTEIKSGQELTLLIEIANNERRETEYTVVVLLLDTVGSGTNRSVARGATIDRFDARVAAGQRSVYESRVSPTATGEDLRLVYLLYRGPVPDDPTRGNAYQSVHLGIDVTNESG
jgi:uncharacterized membrane protein